MNTTQQLYEAFMETSPIKSFQSLESEFPNILKIPNVASADVIGEFSRLIKPEELEEKIINRSSGYNHMLSNLINVAIKKGHTKFEIDSNHIGFFPYGIKADQRVQLIINGSLGEQSIKACENLDVLVNGDVGDHMGIFGKNNRIYVVGTTGAFPMSQSENCVLDAQAIGPNQLMIYNGTVVSRGDSGGNFYDSQAWSDYIDEAAPLIGITNLIVKNKWVVNKGMKKSNTTFLTAGKAKKPYVHIDYIKPTWVPQ